MMTALPMLASAIQPVLAATAQRLMTVSTALLTLDSTATGTANVKSTGLVTTAQSTLENATTPATSPMAALAANPRTVCTVTTTLTAMT